MGTYKFFFNKNIKIMFLIENIIIVLILVFVYHLFPNHWHDQHIYIYRPFKKKISIILVIMMTISIHPNYVLDNDLNLYHHYFPFHLDHFRHIFQIKNHIETYHNDACDLPLDLYFFIQYHNVEDKKEDK